MTKKLYALIPDRPSGLYDSLGIDLMGITELDGEIISNHFRWIDGGDFPLGEDGDVNHAALWERVGALADEHSIRIDWSTKATSADDEYYEYVIEGLTSK